MAEDKRNKNTPQIEIVVDCNSDNVTIIDNSERQSIAFDVKHPNDYIKFIQALFGILYCDDEPPVYISLIKIDEDSKSTVEEW